MRIDCIVCFNFCHYGTVVARSAAVAGVSYMRRGREAPRGLAGALSARQGVVAGSDASYAPCMHSFFHLEPIRGSWYSFTR